MMMMTLTRGRSADVIEAIADKHRLWPLPPMRILVLHVRVSSAVLCVFLLPSRASQTLLRERKEEKKGGESAPPPKRERESDGLLAPTHTPIH